MTKKHSSPASWPLVKRLVRTYLRPRARELLVALAFMIVAAACTAIFAKLIQPVMDDVLVKAGTDPDARSMILPMAAAIFACFAVRGVAGYGQSLQMMRLGQAIIADIQNDLFRHLVRLDLSFFHHNPSGQLTSRMISDVNVMRAAVSDSLAGIGNSFLTLVFLCGVMIYQDWRLALIALCVLPLASYMISYLGRRLRKISGSLQDRTAILVDRLAEIFQGIRLVQAYCMEDAEGAHAKDAIDHVRRLNVKTVQVGEMITPVNETLIGITICAIIIYGGFNIANGMTTAGTLMSFIAAFSLAYEPMKKLGKMNNSLQVGLGATERVFALMDLEPEISDRLDAYPLMLSSAPEIAFDHVSFGYAGADDAALSDVNIKFPAGKVTALVGASGGGKTTILNMMLRFYDVTSGAVTINGTDIRDVTLASLRRNMALVSQDIGIFNMTVRDNIAYGRTDAPMGDVVAAAMAAAAHEFIMELPKGYETVVGQNGVLLSGGQRQRLSIARAILRNAPILLLDEATSALDNESEQLVQQSLRDLETGRTTIVVAHRLSTIRHADQIVVLDGGRVVEVGMHDDLLAAQGTYARLHGTLAREQEIIG